MLRRINGITSFLMSVSVSALWSHQASAGHMIQDPLTCDVNDPKSTIESCDSLIKHYKEVLIVTELDIRSRTQQDPGRTKQMLVYGDFQKKLDNAISNRAKIQEQQNASSLEKKSYFKWPNSRIKKFTPFDTSNYTHSNYTWSGTGTAIQTSFGLNNIYRVTGSFIVPFPGVPVDSQCSSAYTNFGEEIWIGLGGDISPAYMAYPNENGTLYQAGVEISFSCDTGDISYTPWVEDLPHDPYIVPVRDANKQILPISAGDIVKIVISYPEFDAGTKGSTMTVSMDVTSTEHFNWTSIIKETDPDHLPPTQTAEAIVERECLSSAENWLLQPYCPSESWLSPLPYPETSATILGAPPNGKFVFSNLKYSVVTESDDGVFSTVELNLNTPYSQPNCDNIVQGAPVFNQCTINVNFNLLQDTCDSAGSSVASPTSTTISYVSGPSIPNEKNGLCTY